MPNIITENEVELAVMGLLEKLGYSLESGPNISEGGLHEERKFTDVILKLRLREALLRINPEIPITAIDDAIKKILRTESQNLTANNHDFHKLVTDGVDVEYKRKNGELKYDKVWLFDFTNIENNEFLAVNQLTVIEERINRRPDIVIFINGLPIVLFELKNPADEDATIWSAYNQIQTYMQQIPSLFRYNEILIISDGLEARAGTLSSQKERFTPWKSINGKITPKKIPQIEVMIKSMLQKKVLFDLIRHFIVFETEKVKGEGSIKLVKKLAAYHQYNVVNKAVQSTIESVGADRKAGVVWHTQGSGKSLSMVFYDSTTRIK